jgi:hypothetical protein
MDVDGLVRSARPMMRHFLRCVCVLAAFGALSLTAESQGQKALTTAHYTVVARDGAEADLGFALLRSGASTFDAALANETLLEG